MKNIDELLVPEISNDEIAAKFRARVLGLFYEKVIRKFLEVQYGEKNVLKQDYRKGTYNNKRKAIDFVIKKGNRLLIAEAKCWPAYRNGQFRKLRDDDSLLEKIKGATGGSLMKDDFVEKYQYIDGEGEKHNVQGKILIWWDYEKKDEKAILEKLKLEKIYSIKEILTNNNKNWKDIVDDYKKWIDELFEALS